jgi:predicted dehydrogenase/nucleoside-diphosphate-sugar epimerase
MMPSNGPTSSPLRIAVVGCGAVTRTSLLPVLAGHDRIRVVALVDRDLRRARELADAYRIGTALDDMAALTRDAADAVVLATPPAHHARAAIELSSRGFHVFVEKPMAVSVADAEAMVAAADANGVTLAVGLYRRLLPVVRLLRGALDSEMLGRPVSVDIEEGGEYSWELATLSVLTRDGGGGGVLIDIGTHLLDELFFLLPGTASVVRYADNARGGVETDCELRLSLATRWGAVPARVELSRTRQLRGSIRVECERGTFELHRGEFCKLQVHPPDLEVVDAVTGRPRAMTLEAAWEGERELVGYKAFRTEFDDWLRAIDGRGDPQLSGRSVVPVVRAIEESYARAERLNEPWVDGGLVARAPAVATGARRRVLVTGAGGFLGCRLVECLRLGGEWDVRPLVRRPASAARLARFAGEIVLADVTSGTAMADAARGCDAVVHCAVGTGWPPETAFTVTVDGTKAVAEAALKAGARFVHISSMAVHGEQVPARLDESAPLQEGEGFGYGRAKCLAERAVMEWAARGLPAIVLRPARIYGPFSKTFTVRPLQALSRDALVLAGDADSPANMVYVDNVVESILCALDAPATVTGEAFLVNEPDQLSWLEFYRYFARPGSAGPRVTGPLPPRADAPGLVSRSFTAAKVIATSPEVRALAKKIMWTDPVGTLPRKLWDRSPGVQRRVLTALGVDQAVIYREPAPTPPEPTTFTIEPTIVIHEKAARLLGYTAAVSRSDAMALTLAWAQQARLA